MDSDWDGWSRDGWDRSESRGREMENEHSHVHGRAHPAHVPFDKRVGQKSVGGPLK